MKPVRTALMLIAIVSSLMILSSCDIDIAAQKDARVHIIAVALDYADTMGVNTLSGTVSDALEVSQCLAQIYESRGVPYTLTRLIQKGENANMNGDGYPSADNIRRTLESLQVTRNDLVIFYYSGHGTTVDIEDEMSESLLVTGKTSEDEFYSTFSMWELIDRLEALPCQSLVLIDACYSGNGMDAVDEIREEGFLQGLSQMFQKKDLRNCEVFAACQKGTLSYVDSSFTDEQGLSDPHSDFTLSLLEALGWRHSTLYRSHAYCNGQLLEINGICSWPPDGMTTMELWQEVMGGWDLSTQMPVHSLSHMDVHIVPSAR